MALYDSNLLLDGDYTQAIYEPVEPTVSITNVDGTAAPPVTTVNGGGGGQVVGPTITFSGGTTGLNYTGSGNTITLSGTLVVANGGTGATTAAGARTNLGAAASGINTDITQLNGASQVDVSGVYKVSGTQVVSARNTGWTAWTGTADKTTHATFSGTASAAYVQAELQAVMDSLKQTTEALKAVLDALIAHGLIGA